MRSPHVETWQFDQKSEECSQISIFQKSRQLIGYVAFTVGIQLAAQSGQLPPVAMPNVGRWLVDQSMASPDGLVEQVGILAATRRGTCSECLVEQTDIRLTEQAGPERRVRGGPELPRRSKSSRS